MPPKAIRDDTSSGPSTNNNNHSLDEKKFIDTKIPRATSLLKKVTIFTLWNLTKKYEVALKKDNVVAIKEAELDRAEIANTFLYLTTPWERILDGRFYKTLATMQHRRDTQLVTPALASQDWITQFASEVKRRATPLLFLISREVAVPPLALPHADSPVALAEAPTQDDRLALRKYQVSFIELPPGSVNTREKELMTRLHGKRFTFMELSHHLTNWELDLLSQMIRDNTIPAVFNKTSIHFQHPKHKKSTEMPLAATAIIVTNHEEVTR